MIEIRYAYNGPVRLKLEGPRIRAGGLLSVLHVGLEGTKVRLSRGLDQNDQPAKPLSRSYSRRKRREGKPPIRDLRLTGDLLDNLVERYASETQAAAYSGGPRARVKTQLYWDNLMFSETTQRAMAAEGQRQFSAEVQRFRQQITGGPSQLKLAHQFQRNQALFSRTF